MAQMGQFIDEMTASGHLIATGAFAPIIVGSGESTIAPASSDDRSYMTRHNSARHHRSGGRPVKPLESGAMTDVDEHGRPEPPVADDEAGTLIGFLEYQRATLAWKFTGVDAAGLVATVGVSTMTLGGLLKHMAYVEYLWFSRWLDGQDPQPPWDAVDWTTEPDWEWESAADDSAEQLLTLWNAWVDNSRALVAAALTDGDLGRLTPRSWPNGRSPSLRWILCHMIEEYARHNGHADLIRESVDGQTGE